MEEKTIETFDVKNDYDVVRVRQAVRKQALEMRFSMITQTKIATVASELARNMLTYAKEGSVGLYRVIDGARKGLKMVFRDEGPGIKDVAQAMRDGYSSSASLGMGLALSRKFSNVFDIQSEEGKGTTVTVINWVKSNEVRRPAKVFGKPKLPGGTG